MGEGSLKAAIEDNKHLSEENTSLHEENDKHYEEPYDFSEAFDDALKDNDHLRATLDAEQKSNVRSTLSAQRIPRTACHVYRIGGEPLPRENRACFDTSRGLRG